MTTTITTRPHIVAEICADLVDVLTDSIDEESLHTLVSIFLEVSGSRSGAAFTVDHSNEIDEGVALTVSGNSALRARYADLSYVAQRALHTLQAEFSVTSNSSRVHYEYAFPLRVRGRALGAVVLYSTHNHLLGDETISLLQGIADIAASTMDHTHQAQQNRTLATQLQAALNSRIVLEQAKGVLAERSKIDCIAAFGELRQMARREQRPIHQVAHDIVSTLGTPQHGLSIPATASVA